MFEYTAIQRRHIWGILNLTSVDLIQGCLRVISREDCALTVYFRPDRGGDRIEIVFELGRLWGGKPQNLDDYTVSIYSDGTSVAEVNGA